MSEVLCLKRFPMKIENVAYETSGRHKDTRGRHTSNTCSPCKLEGYSCCLTGATLPLVLGVRQQCSCCRNWPVSHESYCRIPSGWPSLTHRAVRSLLVNGCFLTWLKIGWLLYASQSISFFKMQFPVLWFYGYVNVWWWWWWWRQ